MTAPDLPARTARVLATHGLSLPEHYVMCSAGYRVTLPPDAFLSHVLAASDGDPRGHYPVPALAAALEQLQTRGLLSCLTDADLREDGRRRAASAIPEVIEPGYQAGHVDFTATGYALHRQVIRAIHGDGFLARSDAGSNLDVDAGRFDVFAVSMEECRRLMDEIATAGDAYTGADGTRFVGRDGPTAIGAWRPNRFIVRESGYHGVVRFVIDAPGVRKPGPDDKVSKHGGGAP